MAYKYVAAYLTVEQYETLRRLAYERRRKMAAIMREALHLLEEGIGQPGRHRHGCQMGYRFQAIGHRATRVAGHGRAGHLS